MSPLGLLARLRRKGFEGPFYSGVQGKIRFLIESTVARSELIFVANPGSFAAVASPASPAIELHGVRSFAELGGFGASLEAEYYPGYLEALRAPFTWGEEAVVATMEGTPAGIAWLQFGTVDGFPSYYGRMFKGEARVLRVGVVPSFRRRGINTAMLHGVLAQLFAAGTVRVYIECYKYNLPSVRTFLRVGFRLAGVITVLELPGTKGFVRWANVRPVEEEFHRLGIELRPSAAP